LLSKFILQNSNLLLSNLKHLPQGLIKMRLILCKEPFNKPINLVNSKILITLFTPLPPHLLQLPLKLCWCRYFVHLINRCGFYIIQCLNVLINPLVVRFTHFNLYFQRISYNHFVALCCN